MSASSKTINGALPPSSNDTFFTVELPSSISLLPTSVLPVNAIISTLLCLAKYSPIVDPGPVTTLKTPLGNPAFSKSSANISVVIGVKLAGFTTTVLPTAMAATALQTTSIKG